MAGGQGEERDLGRKGLKVAQKTVLTQVSTWTAPCTAKEPGAWGRIFAKGDCSLLTLDFPRSLRNPVKAVCLVIHPLGTQGDASVI